MSNGVSKCKACHFVVITRRGLDLPLKDKGDDRMKVSIPVVFRIVVVNYAAILFILVSFRPLSVTDSMWVHFLSSPVQRFGFAFLAAA